VRAAIPPSTIAVVDSASGDWTRIKAALGTTSTTPAALAIVDAAALNMIASLKSIRVHARQLRAEMERKQRAEVEGAIAAEMRNEAIKEARAKAEEDAARAKADAKAKAVAEYAANKKARAA